MTFLATIAALAWAWLLLCHGRFWRIDAAAVVRPPESWPEVVAVIPARDEAEGIGRTVASLLQQDYPGHLSVVVADDHSTDGTAELARKAAAELGASARLTVIAAPDLPAGWTGKMWAQSNGIAAATTLHPETALLLLTDADIGHDHGELTRLVERLEAESLDMASLMVRLSTDSLAEKAVVPAFVFFFRMLYPFAWVREPLRATAAAAGGYVLIRRAMLERIGGVEAIKGALIDDCTLAATVKGAGGRISLDLAASTVSLRHYPGPEGLWKMIARSAYTQLNHSPLLLAGTILAMTVGFVLPPLLVLTGAAGWMQGALAWAAMTVAYAPMVRFYRQSLMWAPLLPLVALFYMGATVDSALKHWLGRGGEWKGRIQAHHGGGEAA
jgi:hopene-associated glycosyltransferase HpnB